MDRANESKRARGVQAVIYWLVAVGLVVAACDDTSVLPTEAVPIQGHRGAWANDLGPNPKFGVVELGITNDPPEVMRRRLGLVKRSGATWVRETWYWNAFQRTGVWEGDWDAVMLDRADTLQQAASDSGLKLYITLERTPAWARGCAGYPALKADRIATKCSWEFPPGSGMWLTWYNFVRDMVARYDSVDVWGAWNEPNSEDFLRPLDYPGEANDTSWALAYWHLFGWAAIAVHDAGKMIAGPDLGDGQSSRGLSQVDEFWDFLVNNGWRLNSNDKLTFHFYNTTSSLNSRAAALRAKANEGGFSANELWLTETATENGLIDVDQEAQAMAVTQRYSWTLNNSHGVTKGFWMPFSRTHGHPDSVPQYRPEIINSAVNPAYERLAYDCFRALARGLAVPSYCYQGLYTWVNYNGHCNFSVQSNVPDAHPPVWYLDGNWIGTGETAPAPAGQFLNLSVVVSNDRGHSKTGYFWGTCDYQ